MISLFGFLQFGVLELDQLSNALVPCPSLLNLDKYKPDLEDLGNDEKARQYWLSCFEKGLDVVGSLLMSHLAYQCQIIANIFEINEFKELQSA